VPAQATRFRWKSSASSGTSSTWYGVLHTPRTSHHELARIAALTGRIGLRLYAASVGASNRRPGTASGAGELNAKMRRCGVEGVPPPPEDGARPRADEAGTDGGVGATSVCRIEVKRALACSARGRDGCQ
jgi:hypothetical protein